MIFLNYKNNKIYSKNYIIKIFKSKTTHTFFYPPILMIWSTFLSNLPFYLFPRTASRGQGIATSVLKAGR